MKAVVLFCLILVGLTLKTTFFEPLEAPERVQVFSVPPEVSVSALAGRTATDRS